MKEYKKKHGAATEGAEKGEKMVGKKRPASSPAKQPAKSKSQEKVVKKAKTEPVPKQA